MPITLNNTTLTGLAVGGLPAGSVTATNMHSGAVLQVVQTVKKDTWSGGGAPTTFYTVDGFAANITPQFSTSKIMIKVNVVLGTQYWEVQGNLLRNGANIADSQGTARGSRLPVTFCVNIADTSGATGYDIFQGTCTYLDSPATTSAVSYGVSLNGYSTYPIYVNRSYYDADITDYYGQPISTITLMEIKA
jgi:hypothetical protein